LYSALPFVALALGDKLSLELAWSHDIFKFLEIGNNISGMMPR